MRVHLERVVEGVAPNEAARWWNDFRDGREDHAFLAGERRRILRRAPDEVEMEDELRLAGLRIWRERTTAWPGEADVRFEGVNGLSRFTGRYSFEPDPRGTLIRLEAEVALKGPLAWTELVAKPVVMAILRADLAHHAKDLRSDLRGP